MEEEDKKVDSGNNEDFSNDSSTSNDKNDDEIVIDFSKVTKLFKRKNKSENAKDSSKIEQEVKGHVKKVNDYNVKPKTVANKKKKTTTIDHNSYYDMNNKGFKEKFLKQEKEWVPILNKLIKEDDMQKMKNKPRRNPCMDMVVSFPPICSR